MENKRILAIVPAYNEQSNISHVIRETRRAVPRADIAVVNDGSSDDTSKIARESGATVLDLPFNLGIGGAVQTGLKFAAEKGYDIAFQIDGDGQHEPKSAPGLIKPIIKNEADLVIGSRYVEDKGYRTPPMRRMGMLIFSAVLSLIARQKITDTTSGFRAMSKEAIHFFAENYPCDYPEVEAIMLAHFAGLRICEVPASMNER